ncbi:MAG TPA: glycoside hydrolase family 3 N-terminal domain-containing protein, partial [Thermoanaerobaculia bacterium]|nr:glycoside hydrolase family 3 N-terminal domain-containing protein [Thermoanaerobaculia bacterium]
MSASERFVFGLEGPELSPRERTLFSAHPPLGFLLFRRNLSSPAQAVSLISQLRALASPAPLLFVDQEGGTVDRIGPLLGRAFPPAALLAGKGTDRVHEGAFLMGRAARLLGFDVDFAPVLDLAQPGTGAVVLEGRCFGFHPEDVTLAGTVFLHGLARAGVATCLKHFPGLGRGPVDSHLSLPVVDAHDVDLMVTDVHPFTKLARSADGVMVGHAAYPGFTDDPLPASLTPFFYGMLRSRLGFAGVIYTDDLTMGALDGGLPGRCAAAAAAGADVLVVARGLDAYEACVARVRE